MTPTATRSPPEPPRVLWPILIGTNAPFVLWTLYALALPFLQSQGLGGLWCPTQAALGWCPACGMTRAYAALLHHGQIPNLWTICILLGFLAVAALSIRRAFIVTARKTCAEL